MQKKKKKSFFKINHAILYSHLFSFLFPLSKMEDINDYWKMMEYPPVFTNIDWNEPQGQVLGQSQFIPMEYDQQKVPYHHQPFQRRRSSSVDLPINPLYSNTNRLIMNEPTIPEEEFIASNFSRINRIGSSAVKYISTFPL